MPKLPPLNAREVEAALKRGGFVFDRQKGSHRTLWNASTGLTATIPMHSRDLATGTLHRIVRQAGLTDDEFLSLVGLGPGP